MPTPDNTEHDDIEDHTENTLRHKREQHASYYRAFSSFSNLFKFISDSLGAFTSILPPVNAAITGVISLLEIGEAMFLSEESRKRRAVKAITSAAAISLTIAAAVLIFNPATAPIAAALIVVSIATSTIKEFYFWNKRNKDYNRSINTLNELYKARRLTTDPSEIRSLNTKITHISHHIDHVRERIHEHRTAFVYNALSLLGAALLTVAAFAIVGAIVTNPIGLGIAGVVMIGIATAFAISERIKSKAKKNVVKPVISEGISETLKPELTPSGTAQIVHHLVDRDVSHHSITPEKMLKSDIEYSQNSDESESSVNKHSDYQINRENDINPLDHEFSYSNEKEKEDEDTSEKEGEGSSSPKPHNH